MHYEEEDEADDRPVGVLRCDVNLTEHTTSTGVVITAAVNVTPVRDDLVDAAIRSAVKSFIDDRAKKAIDHTVREHLESAIGPRVAKVLDEGWQTYSSFGEKTGVKKLPEFIAEWMKASSGYNCTNLQSLIEKAISIKLDQAFSKEMEEAKQSFRAKVDQLLSGKIATGLREAFGLR